MVEFRTLIINSLLIGLFIIALGSFSVYLTSENNVNNTLMENQAFNSTFGKLQTELDSAQETFEAQRNVTEQTIPTESSDSLPISTIPSTASIITTTFRNIYNLTFGLISSVLGISPIVTLTVTAILVLTVILMIWRLVKTGQ